MGFLQKYSKNTQKILKKHSKNTQKYSSNARAFVPHKQRKWIPEQLCTLVYGCYDVCNHSKWVSCRDTKKYSKKNANKYSKILNNTQQFHPVLPGSPQTVGGKIKNLKTDANPDIQTDSQSDTTWQTSHCLGLTLACPPPALAFAPPTHGPATDPTAQAQGHNLQNPSQVGGFVAQLSKVPGHSQSGGGHTENCKTKNKKKTKNHDCAWGEDGWRQSQCKPMQSPSREKKWLGGGETAITNTKAVRNGNRGITGWDGKWDERLASPGWSFGESSSGSWWV